MTMTTHENCAYCESGEVYEHQPEPTTTHYHAGWNMVGYLPEMEPSFPFASFPDAKRSMVDDMERECDHLDDGGEHDLANELSGVEQDLNLDNGPEWGAIVGHMSYWIVSCTEEECMTTEEWSE